MLRNPSRPCPLPTKQSNSIAKRKHRDTGAQHPRVTIVACHKVDLAVLQDTLKMTLAGECRIWYARVDPVEVCNWKSRGGLQQRGYLPHLPLP